MNSSKFIVKCPRCGYEGKLHEFYNVDPIYDDYAIKTIGYEITFRCPKCSYEEDIDDIVCEE